jgi:multimeric flavodoxin WrbA
MLSTSTSSAPIVILATPTWLGQPSSACQRVLERLDAELEKDDQGLAVKLTGAK